MHILSGGRLRMKKHIYVPEAAPEKMIVLPVSCFLLRHPEGNVLFDTGCHTSVAETPEQRWGALARDVIPAMGADENIVSELNRLNLTSGDIDIVVNSHLHCDHCGCNEFFSAATIYVHADELAAARKPDMEQNGYFAADWDHPMPTVAFTGEVDMFDDGRIVLVPLPGHTPGLTGLLAGLSNSGAFFLVSDAVALKENMYSDSLPKNTWDPDLLTNSFAEIERIEKSGAEVIYGHDLLQWSGLKKGGDFYD